MAFHADAQLPRSPCAYWRDALFGELQLRQHAVGDRSRYSPGLRQAQAAALAQPDRRCRAAARASCIGMAQRRLRQAQHVRRGGQRAVLVDFLDDGQVDAFKHATSMNGIDRSVRNDHFTSWTAHAYDRARSISANGTLHGHDPQSGLSPHRREARTEVRARVLLEGPVVARRAESRWARSCASATGINQAGLDLVPVGDFAFYDQVLDMSFTLGNLPERVRGFHGDPLDNYFRVARGRSAARRRPRTALLRRRRRRRDDQVVRHQLPLHRPRVQRRRPSSSSTPRACWSSWPRPRRRASRPSR